MTMPDLGPSTTDAAATATLLAEVLLDLPAAELAERTFTYAVPAHLEGVIGHGSPVIVPFGRLPAVGGLVVGLRRKAAPPGMTIRPISAAIHGQIFSPDYLEWLRWIADRYACPLAQVMQAAIPSGLLARCQRTVRFLAVPADLERVVRLRYPGRAEWDVVLEMARQGEPVPFQTLKRRLGEHAGRVLHALRSQELATIEFQLVPPAAKARTLLHATLVAPEQAGKLTKRQEEVLRVLAVEGGSLPVARLLEQAETNLAMVRRLEKAGRLRVAPQDVRREPLAGMAAEGGAPPVPSEGQARAREAIRAGLAVAKHAVYLLHGVTGSGKTEVYLQAIADVLARGKQAIVMVPEIALTPQTLRRFRGRFGEQVAIWHSALSAGERHDEWQRILAGLAPIVIGTRSAIFAPCRDLGLIVFDEEHEGTYKQDEPAPRYHARTAGLERARRAGALVILGSATPSLESYAAATRGDYRLIELPERVESRPLPPVRVVDMREELAAGNRSIFSRVLQSSMAARLELGEQTILFLNRRGYHTFVLCRACGESVRCPRCAVSLIYHAEGQALRCHYCDHTTPPLAFCPACGSPQIRHFGAGTQKVEAAVRAQFPGARVLRLDRDTTRRKESHQEILEAFRREEADVLIGTQMVAKGLDFPKITLVGVLAADASLNLPDFRAAERTFQLITQVAGRSGRSPLGGEVVVQAYAPNHPSVQAAAAYRWQEFYAAELEARRHFNHPPFGHLINVVIAAEALNDAVETARDVAARLQEALAGADDQVLGPVPAMLARLRGEHRQQVVVKCQDPAPWAATLRTMVADRPWPAGVRVTVDVEPGFMG